MLFDQSSHTANAENKRLYATIEILRTAIGFLAAVLFLVGSVLFFNEGTQYLGTWFFVIGSICFTVDPTLKFYRELVYLKRGQVDTLAEREKNS